MPRMFHPSFGHEIQVDVGTLSEDPDEQVAQVIGMMLDYSDVDANSPEILHDARQACIQANGDCIRGNFDDVKKRIAFIQDEDVSEPFTGWLDGPIPEVLVRPVDMRRMANPQGDCDCFSMTIRSRLLALGIPTKFCTVAVDPDDPARFSHVYAVADCSNGRCGPNWDGRVALDTSHMPGPGFEAPNPFGKRAEWPGISGFEMFGLVLIIGAVGWGAFQMWR